MIFARRSHTVAPLAAFAFFATSPALAEGPGPKAPAAPLSDTSVELSPPTPTPKADPPTDALVLHDEAWHLYEAGRYRAAIAKLEQALRVDPSAKELVYNLAVLHEKLLQGPEATRYYRRYLELEKDPKSRGRVEAALRRLEGAEHEQAQMRPPPKPVTAPAPRSKPSPPGMRLGWVIAPATVTASALGAGIAFGTSALASNPGTAPQTSPGVSIDQVTASGRSAHANAVAADVCFGIAIAGAATLLTVLLVRSGQDSRRMRSAAAWIHPASGALSF